VRHIYELLSPDPMLVVRKFPTKSPQEVRRSRPIGFDPHPILQTETPPQRRSCRSTFADEEGAKEIRINTGCPWSVYQAQVLWPNPVLIGESPIDIEVETSLVAEMQMAVAQIRAVVETAHSQQVGLRPAIRIDARGRSQAAFTLSIGEGSLPFGLGTASIRSTSPADAARPDLGLDRSVAASLSSTGGSSPSHGGNTGSNPVGDANQFNNLDRCQISGVPSVCCV